MGKVPIKKTEEFDFIKRLVEEYGESIRSPEKVLRFVGHGAGLVHGAIVNTFIKKVRRSITSKFKDRMRVFQVDARKYSNRSPESKRISNEYSGFNPEVVAMHLDSDRKDNHSLSVLMKKDLSPGEIEEIVSGSEKWKEFFLGAYEEFGDKILGGWNLEYPIIVEALALKADPSLKREYKKTGRAGEIFYHEGDFVGLNVDGFKRSNGDNPSKLLLINVKEDFAKSLIGKKVDYHLSDMVGGMYFGDLVRVLE